MLHDQHNQCPCCDYYSLARRGAHDICPVCYWEDDGTNLDGLNQVSSANHITLFEARQNFNTFGASDQAALSLVASAEQTAGLRREQRATYH
ncbi:MAG: CPCC family cysteine-rich protein [Planctomycetota bacterium]|nr:CPCC family cysteine-rich protein [Planctomycetota bacterium]